MNLLNEREWDFRKACDGGEKVKAAIAREGYRNVVVLGELVWKALGFQTVDWLSSMTQRDIRYYSIPHTSGLSRWYNEPANCRRVAGLLQKLAKEGGEYVRRQA
jgi:hypothetical protein